MKPLVWVEIPIALPSAANIHAHWRERQRRIKRQRMAVAIAFSSFTLTKGLKAAAAELADGGDLQVTLTRVAPRKLDSDNLQGAFKGVRDQVAATLDLDDGSEQWRWEYAQVAGPQCIRIEIQSIPRRRIDPTPNFVAPVPR